MKNKYLIIPGVVAFMLIMATGVKAQNSEILLNQNQFPHPEAAATIGSKTVFTAYQLFPRAPQNSPAMIYLMDNERLEVTDSLNPTRQYGFYAPFIDDVLAIGDSLFAVEISDAEPDGSRGGADNMVLFLDTAFQVVKTYRVQGPDTTYLSRQLSLIGSQLIIAYRQYINGQGYKPRLHIYDLAKMQEKKRIIFPDSSINNQNIIRKVHPINTGYLAFTDRWDLKTIGYALDTNFQITNVLNVRDSSLTNFFGSQKTSFVLNPDRVIYSDNKKILATGYYRAINKDYMALVEFDQQLRVTGIDTFSVPCVPFSDGWCSPFLRDFSLGLSDFRALDSVYIAASQSAFLESELRSGLSYINDVIPPKKMEQNINIYNFDTTGNVNWQKEIRQDSVFFISYEIEATPDGGAMVFSSKYDLKHKLEAHMRISIIKLDRFGNIVGEQEFAAPRAQWSVYPNPAKGKVHITGLPDAHLRKKVVLMDLSGKPVLEQEYKSGEDLQLPAALQGTYLLQVQNENGRRLGVRKIVVE